MIRINPECTLARRVARPGCGATLGPVPSPPASALPRAAAALHELRHAQRPRLAVVRRTGDRRVLAVIDAADQRVHTSRSLEQLVEDLALGTAELGVPDAAQPAAPAGRGAQFSDESFVGLCWLVGARLGRDAGLAPWLSASTSYRLLRRPDAADLGNDADAKRLVDLMAKREFGVAAIVDTAQLPHRAVHQLINSLSLCGLLATGPAPRVSAAPRGTAKARQAHQPGAAGSPAWLGWLGRLWQSLRTG